ncbi:Crp/Fnr family transcriptional regulator [Acinetobacter sp. TYF_19]|uniref:Crp/Fnr family transcriptional regulator n=1 Tax=Acinetobacter sp. TYF_19 TaxID=3367196 RepID=UPI00370AF29E
MLEVQHQQQLLNNNWFAKLPQAYQQYIVQHAKYIDVAKDQAVFRSGDLFDGIYAVLNGAIRLGHVDIEGKEAVAAIAEPIMWFGEISLIDQQPRSHDAIAIQKSTLLHLPKRDVEEFIQATPEFWFHIAQLASQKLRLAFLELIAIQSQNISQRLAQRLLFILSGYGNHISITNDEIHLSQEQLAQMLMCSRQTINQELQNLEKQGILAIAFKKIKILDPAKLHRIAHSSE